VVLQLDTGEAANFTVNKYYYLYDFDGHGWINYIKVTARDVVLDTVTIDSCSVNFPAGAVLTPYAHRYYNYSAGTYYQNPPYTFFQNLQGADGFVMPYVSSGTETSVYAQPASGYIAIQVSGYVDAFLSYGIPDDEGYYDCIKHLLAEYYDSAQATTSMNRIYGKSNNTLRTYRGTMGRMTNTRTLNAIDYLNFTSSSDNYVQTITYSESAS
jgi:hypothetical protein